MNTKLRVLIGDLRKDLASGQPRSVTWAKVERAVRVPPLRRLLKRYEKDLTLFERLRASRNPDRPPTHWGGKAPLPIVDPGASQGPSRASLGSGRTPCRGCGSVEDHRDASIRRRHLWIIRQKWLMRKDWARYTPAMRRRRMANAWAARRAAKDNRILAEAPPRLVRLLGKQEILRRAGRLTTPEAGYPVQETSITTPVTKHEGTHV